jgi:hypothetical protein
MKDPVILCDGNSYERDAILLWFELGNSTSALTDQILEN